MACLQGPAPQLATSSHHAHTASEKVPRQHTEGAGSESELMQCAQPAHKVSCDKRGEIMGRMFLCDFGVKDKKPQHLILSKTKALSLSKYG